jgi:AmmeMemoRadiSam system protein B
MSYIKPPAVAGSFYPADADELGALLEQCFVSSPLGPQGVSVPNSALIAGMVPHAGPVYSGPCAAHLYAQLEPSVRRVILLGVNHRARGHKASLSPWDQWNTPLGNVVVDNEISDHLESQVKFLRREKAAHAEEHSIEIELPFLQRVLDEFTFVPISLSYLSAEECAELGNAIANVYERSGSTNNLRTIILASSDLSHYLSPTQTETLDRIVLDRILALDPVGLLEVVEEKGITMCGVLPTAVMLYAANALGVKRAHLLKHCHSGDITPMRNVVGYASVALER